MGACSSSARLKGWRKTEGEPVILKIKMKKRLFVCRSFFGELAKRLKASGSWLRVVKDTRAALGYLNRVPLVLLGKLRSTDCLATLAFAKVVLALWRSSGGRGLAMYLKVCQIALMNNLSGRKLHVSAFSPRVALTTSGLPRVIPRVHRRVIARREDGWDLYARLWMTLFGLYRVIPFKGVMKISTITNPGPPINYSLFAM